MTVRSLVQLLAAGLLLLVAGCAAVDPPPAAPALRTDPPPHQTERDAAPDVKPSAEPSGARGVPYACDNALTLHARFREDTLTLSGLGQGEETLLRDAGGVTPEQTVWSNDRVRAEFGLPPGGEGAVLHLLQPPASTLNCRRR